MFTVYIIQSKTSKRFYVGYSGNFEDRLRHHNSGANKSTKNKGPWVLVYKEDFLSKSEAWKREHQIKSFKGGKAFKNLINGGVA